VKKFEIRRNGERLATVFADSVRDAVRSAGVCFAAGGITVRMVSEPIDSKGLGAIMERKALRAWSSKGRQAAIRCQATGQIQRDLFNSIPPFWSKQRKSLMRARMGSVIQAGKHRHAPPR